MRSEKPNPTVSNYRRRYLLAALWFCAGVVMAAVGSTLINPPNPVLGLCFWVGFYITFRSIIYAASGK